MPKPDGTLYSYERVQLRSTQDSYKKAIAETKRHPQSRAIYESLEKKAFARLMSLQAQYAGCRYK